MGQQEQEVPSYFKELGWIPFVDEAKIRKAMVCYNRLNANCLPYIEKLLRGRLYKKVIKVNYD